MKLRKLAAMAISSIMIATTSIFCTGSITAQAANLNSAESSIISTLTSCNVPIAYVTQARNYFLLDDVDITADQANTINAHIRAARTSAGDAKTIAQLSDKQQTAVLNELSSAAAAIGLSATYDASTKTLLITKDRTVILESVGGNITAGVTPGSNNNITINNNNTSTNTNNSSSNNSNNNNITNNNGGAAGSSSSSSSSSSTSSSNGVIKQTGSNMYLTYGVIAGLAIVLAGCGIVVLKKNSNKKEA